MRYGLPDEVYLKIKSIINQYSQYEFKIFGSRARGNYKKNSDIDIAVVGNVTENDYFNILNEIDLINIPYTIDIVFLNKTNKKELKESILKEGIDF